MSTALTAQNGSPPSYQIDHDAVLKAVGINARDPNAQALLLVCERYALDPILKHIVLIQGRPYVTRDGLLHVAHRSGQLDGIEVIEQGESQTHHIAKVAVYRKDMGRPFIYIGRYPKSGGNKAFGPEMAVKCGEVMALRRAFDVALCAREELWDQEESTIAVEVHAQPALEAPSRAAIAASFRPAKAPPEPRLTPPDDGYGSFGDTLREEVTETNRVWRERLEFLGMPQADLVNEFQIVNGIVSRALAEKRVKVESVETDGKRDKQKCWNHMEKLWNSRQRERVLQRMREYIDEKRREATEALSGEAAEGESQEVAETSEAE